MGAKHPPSFPTLRNTVLMGAQRPPVLPTVRFTAQLSFLLLLLHLPSLFSDDLCQQIHQQLQRQNCNCTSNVTGNDDRVWISCESSNFTKVPTNLPKDTFSLNITLDSIPILQDEIIYNKLQILNLAQNNIFSIADDIFVQLTSLKTLDLRNNHITGLTNQTFIGLKKLQFLHLSNNPLYVIATDVFAHSNLPYLEEIDLSNCLLYEIKRYAFREQYNLTKLLLSHNQFSRPLGFGQDDELKNLNTLVLSHCGITSLPHFFNHTPKLTNLDLSFNRINTINVFSTIRGLQTNMAKLNLSWNQLTMVRSTAFSGMKLSSLDLSHNSLTYLYWEEWPWQEMGLTEVQLAYNPWDCTCKNIWMIEKDQMHEGVWSHNDNNNTRCASPPKYENQTVFSVPANAFNCPSVHMNHSKRTAVAVTIVIVLLLTIIFIIVGGRKLYMKRKQSRQYRRFHIENSVYM